MQEVVGSIPIASTSCDQDLYPSAPRRGVRNRAACAIRARSSRPFSAGEGSFHTVGSHGHYRSHTVPVAAVERLRIVAQKVGHLLDRRPGV